MRYTQLRAFHYVALHGGFSRAAEVLNQTQPSLSDQVRKLEQSYDTLLFTRESRQVKLTEAGEGLLRLTSAFFETEDQIAAYLGRAGAAMSDRLRIVADSAIHVAGAVQQFRHSHPQVSVEIRTGNTERVLHALRNYEAEIGVVGNVTEAPDLETVDLGSTPIVALVSNSVSVSDGVRFADLAYHNLILRETGSKTRAALEAEAARRKVKLAPVIVVEGREAMREMVAAGVGIGFVSVAEAGQDDRLRQVPILDVDLKMSETLVTLTARREVQVIRAFLEAMQPINSGN
ncbi:MAG: LysR substrate-binding domain-containing protein [Paracoccaceae bacterium]